MTVLVHFMAVGLALTQGLYAFVVAPPGPTFANTTSNCNKWYLAKKDDSCANAEAAGPISATQFFHYNPDVSTDCLTNFWPTYAYCIGVDSTVPTTPASPTAKPPTTTPITVKPTTPPTTPNVTTNATYTFSHPISTWNITTPTIITSFPPVPTQTGQPSGCFDWHLVGLRQSCDFIASRYGIQIDDLLNWNPDLGNDCSGLQVGFWVCIRVQATTSLSLTWAVSNTSVVVPAPTVWTPDPSSTLDPSWAPTPTQGPLPSDCVAFYQAKDDETCDSVLAQAQNAQITKDEFFAWNPVLAGNCNGLWKGYYYCVWVKSKQAAGMPVVTTAPSPTAPGQIGTCKAWYQADETDDCDAIVQIFGRFSRADFMSWNPSLLSDCSNIANGTYYCVGLSATPTGPTSPGTTAGGTTKPGTGSPTTPGGTTTSTPSPVQAGMVAGCQRFYFVQLNDGCWAVANAAGISLDDFYKWNPAVGTDCKQLQANTYVCIGLKSPATTITSGPPVPS